MVAEDVIVDRDHRRRGIGAGLMREMERRAVERGCGYIMLVTDTSRAEARLFHESLGYDPGAFRGFKKYLGNSHQGNER